MAFLELNKDKNLRRDETPFEEQIGNYWGLGYQFPVCAAEKRPAQKAGQ